MKKIAIALMLLALCLCIVPCYAEEADDSIVMENDILLISPAPDAAADGEAVQDDVSADDITDVSIEFHPEKFISTLSYMGTGMIGIFIVIGLIVLSTVLLNKVFSDKTKKDE